MRPDALQYDTEFEVKLYVDGLRYWYQLKVNPEKVSAESLYVYQSNRPTRVFSREDVEGVSRLNFNPAIIKLSQAELDVLSISCLRNMSMLAVLKKVNVAVPFLNQMRSWIDERMMPLQRGASSSLSSEAKNMLLEDEDFKQYLMQFAHEADFNIHDIKIKKMMALFGHHVFTNRGEEDYLLPEACQSAGTMRMVELESVIYSQLRRQALLCIDELESSLHPNLMEFILMKFINSTENQSQLIVTTHYDPILKGIDDLFGKDSIWFAEKEKDGNSHLFSLVEFRGLNKLSSIHRAYMNGQFGAMPDMKNCS
jgi:AAA15 family ATPase/GTPase